MRGGTLRHRVELLNVSQTRLATGETLPTYVPLGTVWAAVEPLTGRELMVAQQTVAETTHRVRIRAREGVATSTRVRHRGRLLEVQAVLNLEERDREMHLLCKEAADHEAEATA